MTEAVCCVQAGWGKELTYVIAFSTYRVKDVTRRYTKKWEEVLTRRREVSEPWLMSACLGLTSRLLQRLDLDNRLADETRCGSASGLHCISPKEAMHRCKGLQECL